jgi:hypothetical protein
MTHFFFFFFILCFIIITLPTWLIDLLTLFHERGAHSLLRDKNVGNSDSSQFS